MKTYLLHSKHVNWQLKWHEIEADANEHGDLFP